MSDQPKDDVMIPRIPGENGHGGTGVMQEVEMTQAEFQKMLHDNMVQEVAAALGLYTALGEEVRVAHAQAIVKEQFVIMEQILPTLVDPDSLREFPTFIISVQGPTGNHGQLIISKTMAGQDDPGQALYTAFMTAFLSTPIARALMRIHGFNYSFAQTKTVPPQKGRIIM